MKSISRRGVEVSSALILLLGIIALPFSQEKAGGQSPPVQIAEGVFLLPGLDCNVVAVVNSEGVLLIDNGSSRGFESLTAQVASLGSGPVRIVIDSHFHFDHVGANEALSRAGATIIGHDNTRKRMMTAWSVPEKFGVRYPRIPAYPETALPVLTFDRTLRVHFTGHEIEALHFPNAHSNADIAVYLRDDNILHTGDLYLSNGFPILDSYHGGTIDGLLSALDGLIEVIDEHTVVVPGHGPLSDRRGLRAYREMLAIGKGRIVKMISEGLTLEEVVKADPTAGLYKSGDSWLDPILFVWTVFVDLTGQGRGQSGSAGDHR